jgi:hypothetical protein
MFIRIHMPMRPENSYFQNDLKDHYFKCSQMKAYYSYLFNTIVKYNPKDLGIE